MLGPGGPFEVQLPGFKTRAVQQQLAEAIEQTLSQGGSLVAESGTGTGKTFAYLVPAVLSEQKIIVSTYTKTLQDQLFKRDLPEVCRMLGRSPAIALLKGRSNYICLHRLDIATDDGSWIPKTELALIETVRGSVKQDRKGSGDIAEISDLGENSAVIPLVTSTADNCLGSKCSFYQDCYVNKARQKALAADILIVNHHLFCADLGLKEDGFGNLLPGADAVVFDEAHQLAGVASIFLGTSIASGQVLDLCRDISNAEQREQSQIQPLLETAAQVKSAVEKFRDAMPKEIIKQSWQDADRQYQLDTNIRQLTETLSELADFLQLAAPVGEGLSRCWERCLQITERLSSFWDEASDNEIRWIESTAKGFRLHITPKDIGRSLSQQLDESDKCFIYTSATLSVQGRFEYFLDQVGAVNANTVSLPSPFDYERQALLYAPLNMPNPNESNYTERAVETAIPIIKAAGGKTFFLFTSHRALRIAAGMLESLTDHALMIQGDMPRHELLQRFRSMDNAVLLGSASFWEGVDVKGEALSCVLIDKLPFESPSEPVLRARFAALEEQGKNPFMDYQLPTAAIALKQGVGRLIRDENDRGVLAIFDPRLYTKSYGRVFLNSLPNMPVTRDQQEVELFLQGLNDDKNTSH